MFPAELDLARTVASTRRAEARAHAQGATARLVNRERRLASRMRRVADALASRHA